MKAHIADQLQALAVPIDTIELLETNPRRGDVKAVAKSYEKFGQRKPIVVRRTGEEDGQPVGIVIAGNHQLQAARALGWTHIAAVFVDDDSATASAYALADNRVSDLGEYDADELAAVLEEMRATPDLLEAASYEVDNLQEAVLEQREMDSAAAKTETLNNKNKPSLDDLADKYQTRETRTFRAELPIAIYGWVNDQMTMYKNRKKIEGTSEAFITLLQEVSKEKKK